MNKKYNKKFLALIIIFFIALYILYYSIEINESFEESIKTRTLKNDGFCVIYNSKYSKITQNTTCIELLNEALKKLPSGYVFIDYIYKIKNVSLSTFHRDVTSSKKVYNTKHTVYTLILYNYDGDLLSVCPGSNQTYPFVWSSIVNINGKSGTAFLFDSDLLHAGCLNNCIKRDLIQYKICHKDDLDKLNHLNGVRIEKKSHCKNNYINGITRKISYFFEMPINYIFYPLMIKREDTNTILGAIQSLIPISFYNNNV
jgi:hypothetical protein